MYLTSFFDDIFTGSFICEDSNNYNISYEIDNVLKNIKERNPVKLMDNTPIILVNLGIKNLPIYENPSHIRKNILTKQEAKKIKLSIMPNDNYHGLGKEIFIKVIDSLTEPRVVFRCKNNKNYIILTTIKDKEKNNIIVPIEVETTTNSNCIQININRIKSIYGKKQLNNYIKKNLNSGKLEKIYAQKKN